MAIDKKTTIREILLQRDRYNLNNQLRTAYYRRYSQKNPEMAWTLLAAGVSRNAGYQMTDLLRYKAYFSMVVRGLRPPPGLASFITALIDEAGIQTIDAMFTILESGNYLIFKDVFPALAIYEMAKNDLDNAADYLSLLTADEFKLDPFSVETWTVFFEKAQAANFDKSWREDWSLNSDIEQHSFALIINEQNQIEDRLLKIGRQYYLQQVPIGDAFVDELFDVVEYLGFARICFPLTKEKGQFPAHYYLYNVADFSSLNDRILTGKILFTAMLTPPGDDQKLLEYINFNHVRHSGSRSDYNENGYSHELLALVPAGKIYSPLLGQNHFLEWNWPIYPTEHRKYRHIKSFRELPKTVADRGQTKINGWLKPVAEMSPPINLTEKVVLNVNNNDLKEIFDPL